jgi:signal transduction histidine kinase
LPDKERKSASELVDDLSQNLEKITYHGKRADSIVKGMLEHSRASRGERQPTDLNALADEYLRLAYHGLRAKHKGFNATLTTDFDKSLGLVELVPQEIGRVLLNLINNAFYAVQQRQRLGQAGYRPEVCVATKRLNNEQAVIRVKDNGMGIPDGIRQKIFQPFFTTKPPGEGTGLGLSLSYDIVTKGHGGTLTVTTKPGEYTEFAVALPISQEHVQVQTLSYSI